MIYLSMQSPGIQVTTPTLPPLIKIDQTIPGESHQTSHMMLGHTVVMCHGLCSSHVMVM